MSCSASTAAATVDARREELRGARAVAEQTLTFARPARFARPALVNGAAGFVVMERGRPLSVAGFTVAGGRVVEIDLLADPARLGRLDLTVLEDRGRGTRTPFSR